MLVTLTGSEHTRQSHPQEVKTHLLALYTGSKNTIAPPTGSENTH